MDPTKVRDIASKGGKAAHKQGKAHTFSTEEAREAGRKGGYAAHRVRRAQKEEEAKQSVAKDQSVSKEETQNFVPRP